MSPHQALLTILLITAASSVNYPDCTSPTTYTQSTTQYKGLHDSAIWDRTRNTSDNCSLFAFTPPPSPSTCGDCDFDLTGGSWYRFTSPYVQIAEFPDDTTCPDQGRCNGYYTLTLVPSTVDTGNDKSKYYGLMVSCSVVSLTDTANMVESYDCTTFLLYKFPDDIQSSAIVCNSEYNEDDAGTTFPTPYSLCMNDTASPFTLRGDSKFYTDLVSCTATRSPTPPLPISWATDGGAIVATLDTARSSLYQVVYTVNAAAYSALHCTSDSEKHDFYKVSMETSSVDAEQVPLTIGCTVVMDSSVAQDEDFYFIKTSSSGDVFYSTEDGVIVAATENGTYILSLPYPATKIPEDVLTVIESWKCAIKDPISEEYITSQFNVSLHKTCSPGFGIKSEETACSLCSKNTYSLKNECVDCPSDQMSKAGSSSCSLSLQHLLIYIGAGIGGVILLALLLLAALYYRARISKSVRSRNTIYMSPID